MGGWGVTHKGLKAHKAPAKGYIVRCGNRADK